MARPPSSPSPTHNEAEFHDALAKTLRNARFLLLVVGDGIREGLENILSLVHQSPEKRFTFAMVELQLYTSSHAEGLMVLPKVITRTREIIRAVVKVEHPRDVQVTVTLPDEKAIKKLTVEEFHPSSFTLSNRETDYATVWASLDAH